MKLVLVFVLTAISLCPCAFSDQLSDEANDLALATPSAAARKFFRQGLEDIQKLRTDQAHAFFQKAIAEDDTFALAHLFLAYDATDPVLEVRELARARALSAKASVGEQKLITWLAGTRSGEYVAAISAMNDLLAEYPHNRFLFFLSGRWMVFQQNYDLAVRRLEQAVAESPYPASLNELAYAYAFSGDIEKAFATLDRYVAATPEEPNPQDSYGEISRLAGRYDQAIRHYQRALQIDPTYVSSQAGIAETLMLMGKQPEARIAFEKAIAQAGSPAERLNLKTTAALTYLREQNPRAAIAALRAVAEEASKEKLGRQAAESYGDLALLTSSIEDMMANGSRAEAVLSGLASLTPTDNDQELAAILRTEAIQATTMGATQSANEALEELRLLALNSHSIFAQTTSDGAIGGVLFGQKKYAEAIPRLQEDQYEPLSMARLAIAYQATGHIAEAQQLVNRLNLLHQPTLSDLLARQLLAQSPLAPTP